MSATPTVVLVHGAFADASSWSAVYGELKDDGLTIVAPPVPLRGVASDAAYIKSVVDQIDGPVVLVGHSYGGAVISNVVDDKVKALVFVAAYALDEGESLGELQGRFADSALAANLRTAPFPIAGEPDGTDVSVAPEAFPSVFANDVPTDVTAFLAIAQRPLAASAFAEAAPAATWKTTPSWGLIPTADTTINPEVHRFGFDRAGMTVVEVEGASHAVALSQPKAVADVVRAAVASVA
ncbi:alpha/beta fold hydrolase [Patulibacter americanus]|uniref:alpha/beta fold hydrolase n=1 Tax=Patulibacter americanus TaxID=588672 RepID=UPI0003B598C5|nr:alpha/beta hydrolase [Patulibacter americanus]